MGWMEWRLDREKLYHGLGHGMASHRGVILWGVVSCIGSAVG